MLHIKEDETINTFTEKLTTLANKAGSLRHTIEDQTLVRKLLNAVPDRYLQIVASIEQYSDLSEMTMEEAIGRLKTYEERIKYKKGKQVDNQEKLMFTRHESKGKYFRGRKRGKHKFSQGHIAPNCPQRTKTNEQSNLVEKDLEPTLLMAILEDSDEGKQVKEVKKQKISLHEEDVGYKEENMDSLWYLHNRASNHMTRVREHFKELDEKIRQKIRTKDVPSGGDGAFTGTPDKCKGCKKTVHLLEKITSDGESYHKNCFTCSQCNRKLTISSYSSLEGLLFCKQHTEKLFKEIGGHLKATRMKSDMGADVHANINPVSGNMVNTSFLAAKINDIECQMLEHMFSTPNTSTKVATTGTSDTPSNKEGDGSVNVSKSDKSNGKSVMFLVIENYVKNGWSIFGLVRTMMNSKGIFFFKFSSNTGIESLLENGPGLIHNVPLILPKCCPLANVPKEDLKNVLLWVKLHHVPVTTLTDDGLSVIATKLGTLLMLNTYTTSIDNENGVEKDDNERTSFMASKSSKDTSSSKSGGGTGRKTLYERWKDDYNDNPYDDDDDDECKDLREEQLGLCDGFDISLCGQVRR
nr:zinc finger, CCHC-type [Tanacetum cinerariifolium]